MRKLIETGDELRSALVDLGLSQTGLAKLLKARGYRTSEATILRNVQNAVEPGAKVNPHLALVIDTLIRYRDLRRRNRSELEWLEAGGRIGSNDGAGWVDETDKHKQKLRGCIVSLDDLLPGVPE